MNRVLKRRLLRVATRLEKLSSAFSVNEVSGRKPKMQDSYDVSVEFTADSGEDFVLEISSILDGDTSEYVTKWSLSDSKGNKIKSDMHDFGDDPWAFGTDLRRKDWDGGLLSKDQREVVLKSLADEVAKQLGWGMEDVLYVIYDE